MAIYHLQVGIISRGAGRSVVAAAAWQNSCRLYDDRYGWFSNFANKRAVAWSALILPSGAPARWEDRECFWNALEAAEIRKDAQLGRQFDVALPDELDLPASIKVLRRFASEIFCVAGFAADLTLIEMGDTPAGKRHHGYLLIPTRPIVDGVFGPKPREFGTAARSCSKFAPPGLRSSMINSRRWDRMCASIIDQTKNEASKLRRSRISAWLANASRNAPAETGMAGFDVRIAAIYCLSNARMK